MFPENCNGCTTYIAVRDERESISKCLARKVPTCPCMNCLTKCMCWNFQVKNSILFILT
jgi:hypothetical protein